MTGALPAKLSSPSTAFAFQLISKLARVRAAQPKRHGLLPKTRGTLFRRHLPRLVRVFGETHNHSRANGDVGEVVDDDERARAFASRVRVECQRRLQRYLAQRDSVQLELLYCDPVERIHVDAEM